jgi:hypothetical protein
MASSRTGQVQSHARLAALGMPVRPTRARNHLVSTFVTTGCARPVFIDAGIGSGNHAESLRLHAVQR